MVHNQRSTQQSLLITLYVSAQMGHLQVFPFTHYSLIELQRELHAFPLTYTGYKRPRSFFIYTLLGDINLCGTIV
jgi:hypothetical protein